ncbi:MAG: MFS transporter [Pseudomonadota bacterium]
MTTEVEKTNDTQANPSLSFTTSSLYRYYVLIILTLVYASNYADRCLVALVSPVLKEDLGLSDTQLGLLKGLAFALFYSAFSIPIAWLAARWNRVNIVAISLAIWSGFTALAAFSGNYVQLFLTRLGVGIGEAGGIPPSQSIISDYFPENERARAFGIFMLAVCIGDCISLLIGGWVLEEFGWRKVFFIVGIPGILLAAILKLTVREPIRGASEKNSDIRASLSDEQNTGDHAQSFVTSFKELIRIPIYRTFVIAFTAAQITTTTLGNWDIDYFSRSFDLEIMQITVPMAIITIFCFGVGVYSGGYISDKMLAKTRASYGFVPAAGMFIYIPLYAGFLFAPTAFWAFFFYGAGALAIGTLFGPSYAAVQSMVPIHLRALAASIMIAVGHFMAIGVGPLVIGIVSDLISPSFGEIKSLQYALCLLIVTALASAFFFFRAGKMVAAEAIKPASTSTT